MSFLITGFGRSGTKWLSNILNSSHHWNVEHEPDGILDFKIDHVPKRFNIVKNYHYGEVNSYLRFAIQYFIDANISVAIIYRSPYDILTSALNKNCQNLQGLYIQKRAFNYIADIKKAYSYFENMRNKTHRIDFTEMITNLDYFYGHIVEWAGVDPLDIQASLYDKPLNSTTKRWGKFTDLPIPIKKEAIKQFDNIW